MRIVQSQVGLAHVSTANDSAHIITCL